MIDFVPFPEVIEIKGDELGTKVWICLYCGGVKPIGAFKCGTKSIKCRDCLRASNFARCKAWASKNRERLNAKVRSYRAKRYAKDGCWRDTSPKSAALKAWMVELKSNPCADCGGRFEVCCMDFDHRPGTTKEYNLGSMFAHHYGRELIEKELAKCELVCANCHRVRTRNRRTGSGGKSRGKVTLEKDSEPKGFSK